jgi:hypothetical protein
MNKHMQLLEDTDVNTDTLNQNVYSKASDYLACESAVVSGYEME